MNSSSVNESPSRSLINPQEESLQALCKQIFKSRLFRGFYIERRYVEILQGYRDIVALENGERELHKLLLDIRQRVLQFYWQSSPPLLWIGITSGKLLGAPAQVGAMETFIWTELNELAYGQYWFSIRTMRFRENEILLKLKMVRLVENDGREATLRRSIGPFKNPTVLPVIKPKSSETSIGKSTASEAAAETDADLLPPEPQIGLQDFVQLAQYWGNSIKYNIYDFLSNDITKQNIVNFLKFLGLVIISLASGSMYAVKFLGHFTLRFMYELSRLTHVLTPIILKIIDLLNKTIGGFYILLTMVWKDTVYNRGNIPKPMLQLEPQQRSVTYRSIEYNVHPPPSASQQQALHHHHSGSSTSSVHAQFGEFERKFSM